MYNKSSHEARGWTIIKLIFIGWCSAKQ